MPPLIISISNSFPSLPQFHLMVRTLRWNQVIQVYDCFHFFPVGEKYVVLGARCPAQRAVGMDQNPRNQTLNMVRMAARYNAPISDALDTGATNNTFHPLKTTKQNWSSFISTIKCVSDSTSMKTQTVGFCFLFRNRLQVYESFIFFQNFFFHKQFSLRSPMRCFVI